MDRGAIHMTRGAIHRSKNAQNVTKNVYLHSFFSIFALKTVHLSHICHQKWIGGDLKNKK